MKKYPNLSPEVNLKTRTDLIDYDYIHKLSDEDKKWLDGFTEEYINTNFKKPKKKRIHPKKTVVKQIKKTGEDKKVDYYKNEAEQRNNARNRCIFTRAKASGALCFSEDLKYRGDAENKLIDQFTDTDDDSSNN